MEKILKSAVFFFVFCIFPHENKTKSYDFNRFRKVRERATTIVPWENCPKKESVYPKREIDIDRLQKIADISDMQNHYYVDF